MSFTPFPVGLGGDYNTETLAGTDIDWSLTDVFYKEISANTTFSFSNLKEGKFISLTLNNTSGSAVTISFPAGSYKDSVFFTGEVSGNTLSNITLGYVDSKVIMFESKELSNA